MSIVTLSPVAQRVGKPQDVTDRKQVQAWGLCVHTTGRGLPEEAKKLNRDGLVHAVEIYCRKDANFPHYVIGPGGDIRQIADDKERARHAGIDDAERKLYESGEWKKKVSAAALALWERRWPGVKNPLHLFPSRSPNEDYLGVELIPSLTKQPNGTLFTDAQYESLGKLCRDIEQRHGIKLEGKRLVGHEDLEPLSRWDKTGGWDPGGLRPEGKLYFDWGRVRWRGV